MMAVYESETSSTISPHSEHNLKLANSYLRVFSQYSNDREYASLRDDGKIIRRSPIDVRCYYKKHKRAPKFYCARAKLSINLEFLLRVGELTAAKRIQKLAEDDLLNSYYDVPSSAKAWRIETWLARNVHSCL